MQGNQLTVPQSQITAAQVRASDFATHIHELLSDLEGRLGAVLCAPVPEGKAVDQGAIGPRCLLAEQLEDHASKLEGAAARLRSIIDRIEL